MRETAAQPRLNHILPSCSIGGAAAARSNHATGAAVAVGERRDGPGVWPSADRHLWLPAELGRLEPGFARVYRAAPDSGKGPQHSCGPPDCLALRKEQGSPLLAAFEK